MVAFLFLTRGKNSAVCLLLINKPANSQVRLFVSMPADCELAGTELVLD